LKAGNPAGSKNEKGGLIMKLKEAANTPGKKKKDACLKSLMEKIILQSLEDLWITAERDECINFFRGERFGICADMAGMSLYEQAKLLNLANKIIDFLYANRERNDIIVLKNKFANPKSFHPRNAKISALAAAHNYPEVCVR